APFVVELDQQRRALAQQQRAGGVAVELLRRVSAGNRVDEVARNDRSAFLHGGGGLAARRAVDVANAEHVREAAVAQRVLVDFEPAAAGKAALLPGQLALLH